MARIKVKTGGRPLIIDTQKEMQKIFKYLPRAKQELVRLQRETSGYRSEELFGSSTTLPDFFMLAKENLERLERGAQISLKGARQLREDLKTIKELASPQARVRERALAYKIESEYLADIAEAKKTASKFARQSLEKLERRVKNLPAREKQKFFTSRAYQDIRTIRKEYKHIKDWAKSKTGRQRMSMQEAGYYLIEQRQKDGLDTAGLEEIFGEELPFDED